MSQKFHIFYVIIILIFAGTTIWWVDHSYKHDAAAEHYIQHIKDYPLLDPALPFYEKENLVTNVQPLRDYLKALPEQNRDWANISIYFEVMNTGSNVTVNTDLKVWPASLAKLPLAMVAMKKIEDKDWSLTGTELQLLEEDADTVRTPEIQSRIGESFNIQFLLERLLLESDNTSFNMLVRNIEKEDIISIGESVGLERTFIEDTGFSAKEYTRLMRALYLATYLNEENSQYLLDLMSRSQFEDFIKAGLPAQVKYAHKWGINVEENIYADSGIVYAENRPYMISVMIHGKSADQKSDQAKAEALIKEIGKRSYEFMASR